MTVVNCLLILMILLFSLVLTLTLLKGGTFSIFGNSWHYYQSDVMSGEVERNELLIINKDTPDTFQPDDLVAFYATDAKGTRVIQIARLISVSDNYYEVTEATGDPFILDSTDTVFIGKVEMHSKLLGHLVQQMRTKEGRQIFLGWSVALLLFSCGLTILLHAAYTVTALPVFGSMHKSNTRLPKCSHRKQIAACAKSYPSVIM